MLATEACHDWESNPCRSARCPMQVCAVSHAGLPSVEPSTLPQRVLMVSVAMVAMVAI